MIQRKTDCIKVQLYFTRFMRRLNENSKSHYEVSPEFYIALYIVYIHVKKKHDPKKKTEVQNLSGLSLIAFFLSLSLLFLVKNIHICFSTFCLEQHKEFFLFLTFFWFHFPTLSPLIRI